jgi:hypothetical protein
MSYDLYFFRSDANPAITQSEFESYFSGRSNYELKDQQAWYANEDTGVYFSFDFSEHDPCSEEDEPDCRATIAFNINLCRPHAFALEADTELIAFTQHFAATVFDPQVQGLEEGEYFSEGFLRGWNSGNVFGHHAVLQRDPEAIHRSLPTAKLESIWRWNYQRNHRQEHVGNAMFVPRIFFYFVHGVVVTAVVWGDGIPILLPEVDMLIIPRNELAPRRWFRRKQFDFVLFDWATVTPLLSSFKQVATPVPSYELAYDAPPKEIERLIRDAKPTAELPSRITFDEIGNRELYDLGP